MQQLSPGPQSYSAEVRRVLDGDTLDVLVTIFEDRDFADLKRFRLRLLHINAPEMKGATKAAGEAAKAFLESLVARCAPSGFLVRIHRKDNFGRVLGELLGRDSDPEASGEVYNFSDRMLATGHAVAFDG